MSSADLSAIRFINPRRRAFRNIFGTGLVLTVVGVVLLMQPEDFSWSRSPGEYGRLEQVEIFGGIFGVILGPIFAAIGFASLHLARRADRDFADFRRGRFLVHWTFTPPEWETVARSEGRRRQELARLIFWGIGGLGLAMAIVCLVIPAENRQRPEPVQFALGIAAGAFAIGFLVRGLMRLERAVRLSDIRRAGGHVFIGSYSAYCGGEHSYWEPTDAAGGPTKRFMTLATAAFIEATATEPAQVCLHLRSTLGPPNRQGSAHLIGAAAGLVAGHKATGIAREMSAIQRLPVPAGREAEARWVVGMLKGEPTAAPATLNEAVLAGGAVAAPADSSTNSAPAASAPFGEQGSLGSFTWLFELLLAVGLGLLSAFLFVRAQPEAVNPPPNPSQQAEQ